MITFCPAREKTPGNLCDSLEVKEILLLGLPGHGKSATGNSLLGETLFPEKAENVAEEKAMVNKLEKYGKHCVVDTIRRISQSDCANAHTNQQTNQPTNQQTGQKQYVPHYYSGGHKNLPVHNNWA
ncbi:hypothetical protein DPMN_017824 [Dreissena polymorpha]|uniref:AIG1-type G domain-containing protein n=1 Tax=Dreissena polymorpha TaxID=45954 RepID=A0A9D4NHL6_DREPO|nr:hypothetical protein DPMN_017824 [Dreissena polymorpha]